MSEYSFNSAEKKLYSQLVHRQFRISDLCNKVKLNETLIFCQIIHLVDPTLKISSQI